VLKALGSADKLNMSEAQVNAFAAAVRWPVNGFRELGRSTPIAHDILLVRAVMDDWRAAAELYLETVSEARPYLLKRLSWAGVMSVGLATFNGPSEGAEEFWSGAARDDGLYWGDPRKALINYLQEQPRVSTLTKIRAVARCWNAFADGKTIDELKPGFQGMLGVTLRRTEYRASLAKPKPAPVETTEDGEARL